MKKFTGNFLLDERRFGSVLRKVGLSMVAILMAVVAFAQAQDTYHVWAEEADDNCFQLVNEYEVDISMRDFIKIDSFSLVLDYDDNVFTYSGISNVIDTLLNGTGVSVSDNNGELTIIWGSDSDGVQTIGEDIAAQNDTTVVFTLQFVIDGVPYSYGPIDPEPFETTLIWDDTASEVWNDVGQVSEILTSDFTGDGSLTVTQSWDDIELDVSDAACFNGDGTVTITVPDETGMTYSFNGTTFTSNASTDVIDIPVEGEVINAWVELDGCVSYKKSVTIFAADSLYFTAADTVYIQCEGGKGDIEIMGHGGTPDYNYYLVPGNIFGTLSVSSLDDLSDYNSVNAVAQADPGIWWVAGNDAIGCNTDSLISNWQDSTGVWMMVEVLDTVDAIDLAITIDSVDCYEAQDGGFTLKITGGTPFNNDVTSEYGYKLWYNGAYQGITDTLGFNKNLFAGDYTIFVQDANLCEIEATIEVWQPEPITFWVEHLDASCYDPAVIGSGDVGSIWIDTLTISGGSGYNEANDTTDLTGYWWVYSTAPDFTASATDTVAWADGGVFASADSLPAGVYYIRVFDAGACFDDFVNPTGDNAIKVLTTEFNLIYDEILCYDGYTDVTIDIETGTGNHTIWYGMNIGTSTDTSSLDEGWQSSNTFVGLVADEYTFIVYDETIGCLLSYTEDITEPNELSAFVYNDLTLPPTCPDNTDGNLVIGVMGGTPFVEDGVDYFEYRMDDNSWVQKSMYGTFAIDNEMHEIIVTDANGCTDTVRIDGLDQENIIEFQDTIWNQCPEELVNIFNAYPWDDGFEDPNVDWGFLDYFEWYGTPMEEFWGVWTWDYMFWTSDSGWFEVIGQGVQQNRDPEWYITNIDPAGSEQAIVDNSLGSKEDGAVDWTDSFEAGDYWIVAMDEWGCVSNIEKIVIMDPPEMEITISTVPAGCDGSTDGQIIMEALNGRYDIPGTFGFVRYQYVMTNQPQFFNQEDWLENAQWVPFTDGSFTNDSLGVINVQENTYYLAIRDWCATENPGLIQFFGPIVIDGAAAVEIAGDIDDYVTDVTCIVDGEEPDYDGSVMGLLAGTTGGFGGYTYTLDQLDGAKNDIDWPLVNESGDFENLPGGIYELTIVDDSLGCEAIYVFDIDQPDPLILETVVVNPSCFDAHDGILRYIISGGTAPYMEVTNNVGFWQDPEDITDEQWQETTSEGWWLEAHDGVWVFDRRVRADEKQIYIKDANGCIYGPVEVTIEEPAELVINASSTKVSCNNQAELEEGTINDGTITVMPVGGWNEYMDDFNYYIELEGPVDISATASDTLRQTTFTGLPVGDYTITLYEYSTYIEGQGYEYPVGTYTNYWSDFHTWADFAPYQNPLIETNDFGGKLCIATYEISVEEPDPIVYDDIDWRNVKCHNEETGEIYVPNIQGGTPGLLTSGISGYLVGLEGPVDYHPNLQSNWAANYYTTDDGIVWFETGVGVNEFTFDNLNWGHYTVHIRDANGCWIYKESGEIENPDTLMIEVVQLVENVTCYGDDSGVIQIDATGGSGEGTYMYAVDDTWVPNPEDEGFPDDMDIDAYLASLNWQANDTFNVTAGIWIGYVMDANGCVAGYATDADGDDIWQHRVDVLEPDPIVIIIDGQDSVSCYGESDGAIILASVTGGKGGAWTYQVVGTDYDGNPVDKWFDPTSSNDSTNVWLTGLPASTDDYTVYAYDHADCKSVGATQEVLQPDPFIITVKSKQDALICYSDQAGLYEIDVLSGGVPFGIGGDGEPIYEMKLEAFTPEGVLIDSLSDDTYAKVKTFNGYAGLDYTVWARDANGCETSVDTFIEQPDPVDYMVEDLTCYGDVMASARITITSGNEGRSYQVWYKEILNEVIDDDWTAYNGWFESTIDIDDAFYFDNENTQDRHYAVVVVDTLGCMSGVDTLTFDAVQTALALETTVTATEACPVMVDLEVSGGTEPYTILVDGDAVAGMSLSLTTGEHIITAMDAHYCVISDTVEVMGLVRDELVETYFGEEAAFVDVEAGVDTMLAEGDHIFTYTNVDGCEVTLNVTVEGVPYDVAIIEIQGEVEVSPMVDDIVEVDGTVTAVIDGEGFFMQDENAAWGGIWVSTTETTGILEGNGVVVTGAVAEIESVTTIVATDVELVTPILTVVPVIVTPAEVEDEMYESVLVTVEGARAMSMDTVTGEWIVLVVDEAVVNDLIYASTPVIDHYYNVTGIVNGIADAYTVEPRKEADVVDNTLTPNNPEINSVEFKVYPNPFNNMITIDNNDKLTRVVVSNIAGQRVIDIKYPNREIRTANLVSGVYIISLFTEDGIAKTERIVKR